MVIEVENENHNFASWQKFLKERSSAVTLSRADADAVDRIVDAQPADPEDLRQRTAMSWVRLIQASPMPESSAGLAARAIAAVEQSQDAGELKVTAPARKRSFIFAGRHLAEYAAMAVAATVIISVLIPGIGQARQAAQRVACTSNLSQLSKAFSNYAAVEASALPVLARPADGNWLPRAGDKGYSNADNLLPLVRLNYAAPQTLVCPGRDCLPYSLGASGYLPDNVRGYSYVNLFGPAQPKWDGRVTTIIMADRNPLFIADAGRDPHANSANHGLKGTNVLSADGSVRWASTPDIGPAYDNIWTIGKDCKINYSGTEVAPAADDVFLSP